MQVKGAIGKAILHKLPNEYITKTCACVEYPYGLAWFVYFPDVIKALLDPYI